MLNPDGGGLLKTLFLDFMIFNFFLGFVGFPSFFGLFAG